MKKTLLLLAAAASILTSCKKSNPAPATVPTVLLTTVTDNITGDFYIGKPLVQFSYNGKQLTKAVLYGYEGITDGTAPYDIETHVFNYDNQGNLTGTTVSHTLSDSFNVVSSTITNSTGNISEIKFYQSGNVLNDDAVLGYQNGKITALSGNDNVVTYKYAFSYDSNGNNTEELVTEYEADGTPVPYPTIISTFDTKSNITNTVPFWEYFLAYGNTPSLALSPGTNNALTVNNDGNNFTISYQYNSNGYPSTISFKDNDQYVQSYNYQYITVN